MVLALASVCFVGGVIVGVASYPQEVVWERTTASGTSVTWVGEISCEGPFRAASPGSWADDVVCPAAQPCLHQRGERRLGTLLALGLSSVAWVVAAVLLHRVGPPPDLDPPTAARSRPLARTP